MMVITFLACHKTAVDRRIGPVSVDYNSTDAEVYRIVSSVMIPPNLC